MKIFLLIALCSGLGVTSFSQAAVYPDSFVVAKDGSGNFSTIKEAINAVRDLSQKRVRILIRPGVYKEKLVIPSWKTNISLIGENAETTIITNADFSGKPFPGILDPLIKDKFSTFNSFTVLVQGNDFAAENLTIENTAGRVGQAVALHVEGNRAVIRHCRLLGNQDTLYVADSGSRQLYDDCLIAGTTDFIFGEATVVFNRCTIKSLSNSFITAASTRPGQEFGFVFLDCKLVADTGAQKVFLGRPWRPYAKTVFIDTEMGAHIVPAGWDNWRNPENEKTVLYAEYNSTSAGGQKAGRVKWSRQLTSKQRRIYTIKNVLKFDPSL
ncbi:MAG: pectin esterase [Gemmatimonadaceae bacterium]|nr:pectin esterase [Chitinophagaceae bacterium]